MKKDHALMLAAALAYYVIISLPALLLALIGIVGIFVEEHTVRQNVLAFIQEWFGERSRDVIVSILYHTTSQKENTLRAVLGIGLLFLSITGVFGHLQVALNRIYHVRARMHLGIVQIIFKRFLALISFLLIVIVFGLSILISALLSRADHLVGKLWGIGWGVVFAIDIIASLIILTLLFIVILRVLPDGKMSMRDVVIGSVSTACLFLVGESILTIYLRNSSIASSYGATGSLIILLLWIYYSAVIIFFGAEITKVYAFKYGKGIKPDRFAEKVD